MDDLRLNVLFNTNSERSGRWELDNERMYAMDPRLRLKRFPHRADLAHLTARSAGQRLLGLLIKRRF